MPPISRSAARKLVRKLGGNARERKQALELIASLCDLTGGLRDSRPSLAAAGAIDPLVQLLRVGIPAEVQSKAAEALGGLADYDAAIIAAAGAIPPLVQLLGPGSTAELHELAAAALMNLAENADNQVTITAAGAIPPQVKVPSLDPDMD
ncbi:hypothetical protein FOA52_015296 [Chlamydomonas sp. UWO 241]|nr:hypothetical protein FOA52_015296 [Chlamydomonas sp. UWO 241]